MDAYSISLRSIAAHERSHKDNVELAGIIDCAADEIVRLLAEVEYWKGMAPPAVVRDFPFKPASATCPKCHRTRTDWDCAEDACPMASLT